MTAEIAESPPTTIESPPPVDWVSARYSWCMLLLMLIHTLIVGWSATRHAPSVDEMAHLPAGASHWEFLEFDLYAVNPPLVRMVAALPTVLSDPEYDWRGRSRSVHHRSEFAIGSRFAEANGERTIWFFVMGRWACLPFSLLGAWVVSAWARDLYGDRAGLFALSLWCFSPTLLGNADSIMPDTAATASGVLVFYVLRIWLRESTLFMAFMLGLVLAFALLTKLTWIILLALLPAIWLAHRMLTRGQHQWYWRRDLGHMLITFMVALYLVQNAYAFEGTFTKLKDYEFVSKSLNGGFAPGTVGNRFRKSILGEIPIPLPKNFVLGIDVQKRDFEGGIRSYLLGEWKPRGWLHYYAVALLFKVPLGAWMIVLALLVQRISRRVINWSEALLLVIPPLLVFSLVSCQTGFGHHIRYVLPIFPFVMISVSSLLRPAGLFEQRLLKYIVAPAWVYFVVSSMLTFPHHMSYFNELCGGSRWGHRVLVSSNIDWGQDLLYLKAWIDEHPEAKPLHLAYFGGMPPEALGIEYAVVPGLPTEKGGRLLMQDQHLPFGPQPGWHAISVSIMKGMHFSIPNGQGGTFFVSDDRYAYFERLEPDAMAGYSIYIFHLTQEDCDRLRAPRTGH